ncbi:MAG: hypothetical protein AABW50_00725 [Nanoarchaeota archaeon]
MSKALEKILGAGKKILTTGLITGMLYSPVAASNYSMQAEKKEKMSTGEIILRVGAAAALLGLALKIADSGKDSGEDAGEFFACNYWQDTNQDGKADNNEYVGIKDEFRANESVTLASKVKGKKGMYFTTDVFNPEGKNVLSSKRVIPFDDCVMWDKFGPWELYEKGGVGRYNAQFYINDNLVKIKSFKIIK